MVTVDYGSGSPQEAAAELAYLEGSTTDTASIGSGIEWNDATGAWQTVNWGKVSDWASLRADAPRRRELPEDRPPGRLSPTSSIGRSATRNMAATHNGDIGRSITMAATDGNSSDAAHNPATYATFAAKFAALASSAWPAANLDRHRQWRSHRRQRQRHGRQLDEECPGGWACRRVRARFHFRPLLHAGGRRGKRSILLNDTVSLSGNSNLLGWTTRYNDYQSRAPADAWRPGVGRAGHGNRIQFGLPRLGLHGPRQAVDQPGERLVRGRVAGRPLGQRLQRRLRVGPAKLL